MKQNDNSLLFTFIICLLFVAFIAITVQFDLIRKVNAFLTVDKNAEQTRIGDNQLVTYYQWQENGTMIIDRKPPKPGVEYITFEGDIYLTQSRYDIDPELLARAEAFRQVLKQPVNESDDQTEALISSLLTPEQKLLQTEGACKELESWLNNMSIAFKRYDDAMRKQFCQQLDEKLSNLISMGCQAEIQKFQKNICA